MNCPCCNTLPWERQKIHDGSAFSYVITDSDGHWLATKSYYMDKWIVSLQNYGTKVFKSENKADSWVRHFLEM